MGYCAQSETIGEYQFIEPTWPCSGATQFDCPKILFTEVQNQQKLRNGRGGPRFSVLREKSF